MGSEALLKVCIVHLEFVDVKEGISALSVLILFCHVVVVVVFPTFELNLKAASLLLHHWHSRPLKRLDIFKF